MYGQFEIYEFLLGKYIPPISRSIIIVLINQITFTLHSKHIEENVCCTNGRCMNNFELRNLGIFLNLQFFRTEETVTKKVAL